MFRFLLMTTNTNKNNLELGKTGEFRLINFFHPPFSLPQPVCIAKDTYEEDMYIMLYNLNSLWTWLKIFYYQKICFIILGKGLLLILNCLSCAINDSLTSLACSDIIGEQRQRSNSFHSKDTPGASSHPFSKITEIMKQKN